MRLKITTKKFQEFSEVSIAKKSYPDRDKVLKKMLNTERSYKREGSAPWNARLVPI